MYIRSIELENIKSHLSSKIEFRKGTTAIIGENGAGKTTLIEAIAWALFDLLDYKKDAFLRRGAKRGKVDIAFESVADERTYVVHRDTGTGYYVQDPRLNTRLADKKDEVQRFLRQHMGVEPGTDLETLFRSAIGVPQGTFTSIFLDTPAARKREFDKLLKVEEYRHSSDRLIDTVNHIKNLLSDTENRIAFARGKLAGFDEVRSALKDLKTGEKQLSAELKEKKKAAGELRTEVEKLEKTESAISSAREELEKTAGEFTRAKVAAGTAETDLRNSEAASGKASEAREGHEIHEKALGMLKELERERGERDKLAKTVAEVEAALVKVGSEKEKTASELEKVLQARKRIEELKPKAEEQAALEQMKDRLKEKVSESKNAESRRRSIESEVKHLRVRYKDLQKEISEAEKAGELAGSLPNLVEKDDKLRKRVAELNGRLEIDRKFQSEVRDGMCPILTEKCLNLKEGQTLDGYLSSQFEELTGKIKHTESEIMGLAAQLTAARKADSAAAAIEPLRKAADDVAERGKKLNEEMESLDRKATEAAACLADLTKVEAELKKLGSPDATVKLLAEETAKEIPLRETVTRIESNLERLESERRQTVEQMEKYKDLDFNWEKYSSEREKTLKAHQMFIANEEQAGLLEARREALRTATKELEKIEELQKKLKDRIESVAKDFDRQVYADKKSELGRMERETAALEANIANIKERIAEREKDVAEMNDQKTALAADEAEKKRLERVFQATTFIRSTLKEAAPRVARNYVFHVSIEANQLFRDITGNADHTLKWQDDYGISLEEGGFERPFQNLSGGEQMVAAVAVRLALLKQLSDISLAFFDEPTANLDLERRERLAEQISRITESGTFDQLFVISHDDTFEGYVDNVVEIESIGQG